LLASWDTLPLLDFCA